MEEDIAQVWRVFLLECELARHYNQVYLLSGGTGQRNPLLDRLLPSLLLIRAVSILDEALRMRLKEASISLPNGEYRNNLKGRIAILGDKGRLAQASELQELRLRRNELAHEVLDPADWTESALASERVESVLQQFGYVGERPVFEYFGERSALEGSPDPAIAWTRRFVVGIKEGGQAAIQFSWTENLMNDSAE